MEVASTAPTSSDESTLSTPRIVASPWIVLIVLALGEFMILLDTTIVAVAVPNLSNDLHASFDQLLWVVNAYALVFAVLLITAGRMGDMFGPKKLFLAGLAIFTAASLGCGLAQSPNELIVFRVIQALGGAILVPQTLSIITSIFPPEKRGAAFGAWSAVAGLAAAVGPALGGVLTSGFSWRAVFFPNIPIGIAAIVLAFLMMPELTVHRQRGIDGIGMLLATFGLFGIVFGLVENEKYRGGRLVDLLDFNIGAFHGGLISIPTILLVSLILLVAFVIWERRQDEPVLPLSLFHDRNFSIGGVVAALVNIGLVGLVLVLTLFFQSVLGFSAAKAGLVLIPNALAGMVSAPIAGRLTDKGKGKYLLFLGLALLAIGLALVSWVASLNATGATFILPLIVTGLGVGFTLAPMTALAMRDIAPSAAGAASGFLNTIRQVGFALGAAVVGAVLATKLAIDSHGEAVSRSAQLPQQYRSSFVDAAEKAANNGLKVGAGQTHIAIPSGLPASLDRTWQDLGTLVFNHAFLTAMRPALLVPVPLLAFASLLALRMRSAPTHLVPAVAPAGVVPAAEPAGPVPVRVGAPLFVTDTIVLPSLPQVRITRPRRPLRAPFVERVGGGDRRYAVRDELSIGRAPNNGLVLDDAKVSRNHAMIMMLDTGPVLRDLKSANGTEVNGTLISGDHLLHDGDAITVGDTSFIFHNDFETAKPRLERRDDGRVYRITPQTIGIGRAPENTIVLDDPKVSRRHAQLAIREGQVVIRDLESLNGTLVNNEYVVGDHPLHNGDTVTIGDAPFVFHNDFEAARVQ